MRILIIEDNDIKYSLVEQCLREFDEFVSLLRAPSYQSGIESLFEQTFDRIILDMTLPVYDVKLSTVVTENLTFGGEFILRESSRKRIEAKFVILSQYDTFVRDNKEVTFGELRVELLAKYGHIVLGCVRLDRSSVNWKSELRALIAPR